MEAETREIQYTFSCAHMPARSLSDVQESAQFLAGEQLPATLVGGLLAKSKADGVANIMGLINLTPYEGWVEKACKKGISGLKFKTLSVTKNLSTAQFVEKTLALELLQDCNMSTSIYFLVLITIEVRKQ
jgi:hypothetical protein